MNLKDKIQERIEANEREIATLKALNAALPELGVQVEKATVSFSAFLDIDHPTREDVLRIMAALGAGRWEKTANGATLNYITKDPFVNGLRVRLWAAEPPGSCRVVEETVVIPAAPERVEKRKRLICTPVEQTETTTI